MLSNKHFIWAAIDLRFTIQQLFLFLILSIQFIHSQTLHEYFFNNGFSGTTGAPTLSQNLACGAKSGYFKLESISTSQGLCIVDSAFYFNDGGGLTYSNPKYITNQYSINILLRFNTISGYSRIVDFSNSTADAGIYLLNDCLNFYPNGNIGNCPYFKANLFYLFTFVRNGSTGIISVYVNGTLFATYNDKNTNLYRLTTSNTPIIFFRDDNVVQCETQAGCVKYISITSETLTDIEVADNWANICKIISPGKLIDFKVECKKDDLKKITWTKANEDANHYFTIERSIDSVNWVMVKNINSKGNESELNQYDESDIFNNKGPVFYRLKQTDLKGKFEYSKVVVANCTPTIIIDTVKVIIKDTIHHEVIFTDNNVPVTIKDRVVELQNTITVSKPEFDIEIWDRSVVDGDSISLNLNGKWILEEYEVVKTKLRIHVKVDVNASNNYLILYALNLGEISPNTAAVAVLIDGKEYKLTLTSDLKKSGALNFSYLPKN